MADIDKIKISIATAKDWLGCRNKSLDEFMKERPDWNGSAKELLVWLGF